MKKHCVFDYRMSDVFLCVSGVCAYYNLSATNFGRFFHSILIKQLHLIFVEVVHFVLMSPCCLCFVVVLLYKV